MSKRVRNTRRQKKGGRQYVPGRRTAKIGRQDGGIVLRASGQVRFYQPAVDSQNIGDAPFWMSLLQWLFEAGPDAHERRGVLIETYLEDLQERALTREAKTRVASRIEDADEEPDAETRQAWLEEAIAELKQEAADLAEMKAQEAKSDAEVRDSVRENDDTGGEPDGGSGDDGGGASEGELGKGPAAD